MVELIQYVDADGALTGETEEKLVAHHAHTRKHLAFSCYVFDKKGDLLVTQRAHSKKVWPGVWTNSFCGHPMPGESFESAIERRADYELGMRVKNIRCVVSTYSYITPLFNGVRENEFCPIFFAESTVEPQPNPEEVAGFRLIDVMTYQKELKKNSKLWSWWAIDQFDYIHNALQTYQCVIPIEEAEYV